MAQLCLTRPSVLAAPGRLWGALTSAVPKPPARALLSPPTRALVTYEWDSFTHPAASVLRDRSWQSCEGLGHSQSPPGAMSPALLLPHHQPPSGRVFGTSVALSGGPCQHRCFLSGLLSASSSAAALSTSEGAFQGKVKLVKAKIIERVLFYQRDCLWFANRHETL